MSTPASPLVAKARSATDTYKAQSFEIQALAAEYIGSGVDNEDIRAAIRSLMAITSGTLQVLSSALQPR
jgi:hypothetical protein